MRSLPAIASMPLLFLLFLWLPGPAAWGQEQVPTASLVESGLLSLRFELDTPRALSHFRRALASSESSPRLRAEAIWHMANTYAEQDAEDAAVLLLRTLARDYPTVEPFAARGSELLVELAGMALWTSDYPMPADAFDLVLLGDEARLFEAAVHLDESELARSALHRLRFGAEAIAFLTSLAPQGEEPEERDERNRLRQIFESSLAWIGEIEGDFRSVAGRLDERPFRRLKRRAGLEADDFSARLLAGRDAVTESIGSSDRANAVRAVAELCALIAPLAEGPDDMVITQSAEGELAGLGRVAQDLEQERFAEGLGAWAETRRLFLESGGATIAYDWPEDEDIPTDLVPRVMGALLFVDSAAAELGDEDVSRPLAETETAIEKIRALRGDCGDNAGRRRLDRCLENLREAAERMRGGDIEGAGERLDAEVSGTVM